MKKEITLMFDAFEMLSRFITSIIASVFIYVFAGVALKSVIDFGLVIIMFISNIIISELIKHYILSKRLKDHIEFSEKAAVIIKENTDSEAVNDNDYLTKLCLAINPHKLTYKWKDLLIYGVTQFLSLQILFGLIGHGTFGEVIVLSIIASFYCQIAMMIVNLSMFIYNFRYKINSMIIMENDIINDQTMKELSKLDGFKAVQVKVKEID